MYSISLFLSRYMKSKNYNFKDFRVHLEQLRSKIRFEYSNFIKFLIIMNCKSSTINYFAKYQILKYIFYIKLYI